MIAKLIDLDHMTAVADHFLDDLVCVAVGREADADREWHRELARNLLDDAGQCILLAPDPHTLGLPRPWVATIAASQRSHSLRWTVPRQRSAYPSGVIDNVIP